MVEMEGVFVRMSGHYPHGSGGMISERVGVERVEGVFERVS